MWLSKNAPKISLSSNLRTPEKLGFLNLELPFLDPGKLKRKGKELKEVFPKNLLSF